MKKIQKLMVFLILITLLLAGCKKCPENCDDANKCTTDSCSKETDYACTHIPITSCNGNDKCEEGEYGKSLDCPNCDTGSPCTKYSYDYKMQECTEEKILECCGNGLCESKESLYGCPTDCKASIQALESDKEYVVRLGEKYQFEKRQIEISSIWDDSIVPCIILDTQNICPRTWIGESQDVLGIRVFLVNVTYEIEATIRTATIKVKKI